MSARFFRMFILFVLLFSMSTVSARAADYFDTTDLDQGIIHLSCKESSRLKVIIEKGEKKYTYDLNRSGRKETFPLQMGNGTYSISIYKNTSDSYYRLISTKNVELKLSDPYRVYLNSIQNIAWNANSKEVKKAAELTKNEPDVQKKAFILWEYIVKNYTYDYDKVDRLTNTTGYTPVNEQTFVDQSGICYDFASLYAAMLRSQGIPTKLVKGYSPKNVKGYHAWNEFYDASQKKWIVVDTTYDLQVTSKGRTLTMIKDPADYDKVYEY